MLQKIDDDHRRAGRGRDLDYLQSLGDDEDDEPLRAGPDLGQPRAHHAQEFRHDVYEADRRRLPLRAFDIRRGPTGRGGLAGRKSAIYAREKGSIMSERFHFTHRWGRDQGKAGQTILQAADAAGVYIPAPLRPQGPPPIRRRAASAR